MHRLKQALGCTPRPAGRRLARVFLHYSITFSTWESVPCGPARDRSDKELAGLVLTALFPILTVKLARDHRNGFAQNVIAMKIRLLVGVSKGVPPRRLPLVRRRGGGLVGTPSKTTVGRVGGKPGLTFLRNVALGHASERVHPRES